MSEINWAELRKTADDASRPVPEGKYQIVVTEAEATRAASSGNPMIKLKVEIVSGPASGRRIFHNINLTPDSGFALARFFSTMDAFGMTETYFVQDPSFEQIAQDLVGRYVFATVGIKNWQGQDRNELKAFESDPAHTHHSVLASAGGAIPNVMINTKGTGGSNSSVTTVMSKPKASTEPPLPF